MAYLKPPFFVRKIFNGLAMRFGVGGATTLAVPGRRSGQRQRVPVIPVEHEGARYVVSTRGEAEWVRNLRASGTAGLKERGGRLGRFQATEIPVEQRGPILTAYRAKAGKTVEGYFEKLPDPADHPTFRLEPATH